VYPPKPAPGDAVAVPTTRRMGSTPRDRAADPHAAFADPHIKAAIASIGGSVMLEFGRPGAMHPLTADSLRAALFTSGEYELTAAPDRG
jgi:hypothetical protein